MFELHPVLQRDCFVLGHFSLCQLLLMNERRYPWFILVPMVDNVQELFQLSAHDQRQLTEESARFARLIHRLYAADKLNIAALGNVVAQLHIHHIVRYRDDPAWPSPVWGAFSVLPYDETEKTQCIDRLRPHLAEHFTWRL